MGTERPRALLNSPDISSVVPLQVGKRITEAIGRAHTLESAVSDIIDNSIGAKADHVHVRFMESKKGFVSKIRIRDNGTGMSSKGLADAMRLNPEDRKYEAFELGMFGQGLKASSMSQARELNIYTTDKSGEYCGARLLRSDAGGGLEYGVIRPDIASLEYRGFDNDNFTGTVVEWRQLENVSAATKQSAREEWLDDALRKLRNHIGLIFHRFISNGVLRVTFDRFDEENQRPGSKMQALPIDPFNFDSSGHADFPLTLEGRVSKIGPLQMECHIIPPGSRSESAIIAGQDRQKWQGLYIYWRDRLVHFGDWNLLAEGKKEYSLARVKIDLQPYLLEVVRLTPEKDQIQLLPAFLKAAHEITDSDGKHTLDSFLDAARETLKLSNTRKPSLKPLTRIKAGIPEKVIASIETSVGWRPAQHGISMDWAFLPSHQLFDFDASAKLIRLNSRHRGFLSATEANRHEDAPIVRTLLYLLLEGYFSAGHVKKSTEDQVAALQEILSAALRVQLDEIGDYDRIEQGKLHNNLDGSHESDDKVDKERAEAEQQSLGINHRSTFPRPHVPEFPAVSGTPRSARPRTVSQPVASRLKPRESDSDSIATGGAVISILKGYRKGTPISILSSELGVQERGVVKTLALALLGDGSTDNEKDFAPRHGVAWDPDERSKANKLFRDGVAVPKIAEKLGRTPLSVSWQLLDGPKALPVPDSLIKRLQRADKLKDTSQRSTT